MSCQNIMIVYLLFGVPSTHGGKAFRGSIGRGVARGIVKGVVKGVVVSVVIGEITGTLAVHIRQLVR
jgi:hypothetical protein